jgi:hypothetical protein
MSLTKTGVNRIVHLEKSMSVAIVKVVPLERISKKPPTTIKQPDMIQSVQNVMLDNIHPRLASFFVRHVRLVHIPTEALAN